jgi:hypothetical protein
MPRSHQIEKLALVLIMGAACSRSDSTAPSPHGAPSALIVVSGNNQSALGGLALVQPVTLKLVDNVGVGIPDAAIDFSITAGEGSLAGSVSTGITDQNGVVVAPSWTLGKIAIAQQLTTRAGNLSAIASAIVTTQFHAEVRFFGSPIDPAYAAAFTRAINRLNAEVIGPLAPVTFTNQDVANTCGVTGVAPLNEQISSLVIYAGVGNINGGVVASSGPCYVRQSSHLTVVGTISLNAANLPSILSNGQLNDVVFHEMQHVLGFGTLWSNVSPSLIINAGTPQTAFIGAAGIRGCQQSGGAVANCTPAIPLESGGGTGTADDHWRFSIFGSELMTAFLPAAGASKPLSAMTIGSISDLGYQTNPNVADAYTIPSTFAEVRNAVRSALELASSPTREVVLRPRLQVTLAGAATVMP